MKKGIRTAAALLLACAALCALILRNAPREPQPIAFSGERDILRAELAYDAGTRTLRGRQTLTLKNRSGETLREIVLRASMNAREEDATAITDVRVNGQRAAAAWAEKDRTTLRIPAKWDAGSTIEIAFTLMIRHEKTDGAAIVTLPQMTMHENGAWRTDAFDVRTDVSYAEPFDVSVTVDGEPVMQMENARDASFALGGIRMQRQIGDVRVTAIAQNRGEVRTLLDGARAALVSLDEAGFAYPFKALTIAKARTDFADGTAYSGLIALWPDAEKEQNIRRITRLAARQTFGVLIENDPWHAPWLSVSLASCAEMLAFRERKGASAYELRLYEELEPATRLTRPVGVCVGAGTAHFGSPDEMTQVLRDQGAAMLLGIEQAAGREAFAAALHAYVAACAGKTAKQADLEAALQLATGSSWNGYLEDLLWQ